MAFRVLIVDDSAMMRSMIRRVIEISGLDAGQILEAGDGVEALEMLSREWVDVVLTDVNMPRMNGEELIRRMSESGLTTTIPVIVVSTDATVIRRDAVAGLGARGYLVKPFQPEQLKQEIERVIGVADDAAA
jgi:two-component system chemotaxis response regulator CheY